MAAFGDLIAIVVVGFVIVAGLSLLTVRAPATPPFARRPATAASVQLRQDPNAGFTLDRGFLFRRRFWFAGVRPGVAPAQSQRIAPQAAHVPLW